MILPNYGPGLGVDALTDAAVAAEKYGFDSLWATDHLLVPPEHAPIYGDITEPLVTLGFLAGKTERVLLGVSALIVPMRNPLVVLKQLASLDYLSGGRVVTAVAAGWMEAEFETLGANFESRGRLLDEWIEMVRVASSEAPGPVSFDGRLIRFQDGWLAPGPVRRGGPELWVAGVSDATLRRAATTGVWHPVALTPEQLAPMIDRFRSKRSDGRIVLRINVLFRDDAAGGVVDERGRYAVGGPPEAIVQQLGAYIDIGCTGFVVNLDKDAPALPERVQGFGEEVAPQLG